ncbi:amidohydrolase family protein [Tahibacter amnicola]|uniref:Amidohydrolase family protein n=1 Tax=Tahibacter amnicola TaxID=2976241 RepID=A0ABY6BCB9_9GAMM|nr:amidohydrolase family protein [Tahibacter amnicola]UXI67359.1 amidohydrolase family protein [Tahibacter amnicola]
MAWLGASPVSAQVGTVPQEGIRDNTPRWVALTHARLVIRPGQVVEDGTLVMRDGVIVSAGRGAAPKGALELDVAGKTIFAGFIEAQSDYAQVADPAAAAPAPAVAMPYSPVPQQGARHWNARVRPERDLSESLKPDAKKAESLRKLGFTSVVSTPEKGIFRGQSAVISLADTPRVNDALIKPRVGQHLSFENSSFPSTEYPGSLMGAIALIRQTFHDARWQHDRIAWQAKHRNAERVAANLALDALQGPMSGAQPVVFVAEDELDYGRALAIADEFKLRTVISGNGREYREVARLKAAGVPVIVPLNFVEVPAIDDPERALDVPLSDLSHWEWAPFNARVLAEAGVPFAFTGAGIKKLDEQYWANLRKAVSSGLDEQAALAALTIQPATMFGVADKLGTLEAGKLAQITIADADLFRSDKARIYESWIDGKRYAFASIATPDPRGTWTLRWNGVNGPASVEISGELNELTAKAGDTTFPVVLGDQRMTLYPPGALLGLKDERLPMTVTFRRQHIEGRGQLAGGAEFLVEGDLTTAKPRIAEAPKAKPALPADQGRFPAGEFGRTEPAISRTVVFRHATVWTQGPQGRLDDADVAIAGGRIVAVGQNLKAPRDAEEVDARGKHIAPGIIDPHSHMAVAKGVNEGTHAITSEVRIGDVLDPTDMTIYRQLAGGVTAAHLLHGSANPIGGQAQVIKLRWGEDAEALRMTDAPRSIKFALGENVKQANWGPQFNKRYPQTRMGVEQVHVDSFLAAQQYGEKLAASGKDREPVRRDLRLEALLEILQKKRFVHVHSYRQDEILAFARTAQRFQFVPVFQHILEGYKVADVLASLGAGASTFSDWWAYKMEVADAIPHNGTLMAQQGVVVTFNSDSDEMGRRLNTEAAKAVKYGGMAEVDALNLVTLNAARQLRIDHRVGSLETGKDADLVLWSGSPLSSLSRVEQTWIDGRKYFDRRDDLKERERIDAERQRLIGKALPERIKALAKKDTDKKDGKVAPTAPRDAHDESADLSLIHHANIRGPYHNSEPVNSCSAQESH